MRHVLARGEAAGGGSSEGGAGDSGGKAGKKAHKAHWRADKAVTACWLCGGNEQHMPPKLHHYTCTHTPSHFSHLHHLSKTPSLPGVR